VPGYLLHGSCLGPFRFGSQVRYQSGKVGGPGVFLSVSNPGRVHLSQMAIGPMGVGNLITPRKRRMDLTPSPASKGARKLAETAHESGGGTLMDFISSHSFEEAVLHPTRRAIVLQALFVTLHESGFACRRGWRQGEPIMRAASSTWKKLVLQVLVMIHVAGPRSARSARSTNGRSARPGLVQQLPNCLNADARPSTSN